MKPEALAMVRGNPKCDKILNAMKPKEQKSGTGKDESDCCNCCSSMKPAFKRYNAEREQWILKLDSWEKHARVQKSEDSPPFLLPDTRPPGRSSSNSSSVLGSFSSNASSSPSSSPSLTIILPSTKLSPEKEKPLKFSCTELLIGLPCGSFRFFLLVLISSPGRAVVSVPFAVLPLFEDDPDPAPVPFDVSRIAGELSAEVF